MALCAQKAQPGDRLFTTAVARGAIAWLRIALGAREIPNAGRFTLHSLRRGGARSLAKNGGDLATLPLAGGWRSSAFRSYLGLVGMGKFVVTANLPPYSTWTRKAKQGKKATNAPPALGSRRARPIGLYRHGYIRNSKHFC